MTAAKLLVKVLAVIAQGTVVAGGGLKPELSIEEAAELLHISPPCLVRRLNAKKLPFQEAETQCRICLAALLAFRRQALEDRQTVLAPVRNYRIG